MSERTWHYVMTLQFPHGSGHVLSESSGTVDVPADMSRHDVFQQIRANMIESAREGDRATTLFWSLEPNELGEAR